VKPRDEIVAALVAAIITRTHALGDLASAAATDDYNTQEAPILLKSIARLAEDLRPEVLALWARYESKRSPEDLAKIQALDMRIRELAGDVRLPERATSARVPGVLGRLVRDKVNVLFPAGVGVILRPVWNYHYKIHRDDVHTRYELALRDFTEKNEKQLVKKAFDELIRPTFVVSFPVLERTSIHLHAVLGHEIGHLISREWQPTRVQEDKEFSKALVDLHKTAAAQGAAQSPPRVQLALTARATATKELAADAVGMLLFGISALFGTLDVAAGRGLHGVSSSLGYPSWGLRLQQMWKLAEAEGWLDLSFAESARPAFAKATEAVQRHLEACKDWLFSETYLSVDPWERAGHASALRMLPQIHEFARKRCKAVLASRERAYRRLPALFERLDEALPPDNASVSDLEAEVPELEEVFAAAWWYKIARVPNEFGARDLIPDSMQRADLLRRLTLKAVENIDFLKNFKTDVDDVHGRS
jgi:hypothetical protein